MKRREFIKLSTATVALSAIPYTLAKYVAPDDIKWFIQREPAYGYAWSIRGYTEIKGRPFHDTYIVEEEELSQDTIDEIKSSIMKDIERQYKNTWGPNHET